MRSLIKLTARFIALCAVAAAGMTACKSSDAPAAPTDGGGEEYIDFCALPKSCQDIVEACHPKDDGTVKEINECHETAHDVGTESACKPVHDDCVAKCNAAPALPNSHPEMLGPCDGGAGHEHDAGHHDGGH